MRRYHIKLALFLLYFFVILVLVTVSFNLSLQKSKNLISKAADKYFTQEFTLENLFYLPPNFIILKNLSFVESSQSQKRIIFIPIILARFSLREFLIKNRIFILDARCYQPEMNYHRVREFIRKNADQVVAFIRNLPKQDIKFYINEAVLDLTKDKSSSEYLTICFSLMLKGNSLSGYGTISKDREVFFVNRGKRIRQTTRSLPLRYTFGGDIINRGIFLKNLELMRENLHLKLWGNASENFIQLKGFTFIDSMFKEYAYKSPAFDIIEKIIFFLHGLRAPASTGGAPTADIYILDINCQANLVFPILHIADLKFSLNNIPISIKGDILLLEPISLNLKFFSHPDDVERARLKNVKEIKIELTGALKDRFFKGDGILQLDFLQKEKTSAPLKKIGISFKELELDLDKYLNPGVHLQTADIVSETESNIYKISLNDFHASLFLENTRFKLIKFRSLLYDGFLEGQSRIDMALFPPKITSTMNVKDVSANKLEGLIAHFSKVFGRLVSQIYFSNYPDLNLKGSLLVRDGYLLNFEFFKWLANLFHLPSLTKIDFNTASSNFSVNTFGASLHDIDLYSQDVKLGGFFGLGENDFVTSKLSLTLSRKTMKESEKLKPLLKLLGEELIPLTFDFQLSGSLHGMNFQWLQSEFKSRLQSSIPNFMQRKFEKNLEEAISSISAN